MGFGSIDKTRQESVQNFGSGETPEMKKPCGSFSNESWISSRCEMNGTPVLSVQHL
jgi:hypothetical protein